MVASATITYIHGYIKQDLSMCQKNAARPVVWFLRRKLHTFAPRAVAAVAAVAA